MTKEQQRALALARARKRKAEAEAAQVPQAAPQVAPQVAPVAPPPVTPQPTQEPYVEPEMDDPLMVSDVGVQSAPNAVRATIRNVLQGVSFGTADEAEAALRSAFGDRGYQENLDLIRQEMKAYAEANPGSALSQELIGAVMSPATLLKAPAYIERAAPLLRGGIKGGVGGGVYGAASAEGDLAQRAEEGLVGAGAGVIVGAPLEKAVSLVGNVKLNRQIQAQSRAPDLDRLKAIKDAAYEAVDQTNFAIGPGEAQQIFQRASKIADDAFYVTTPGVTTAVDKAKRLLESLTTKGMTLGQSEKIRQRLFKLAEDKTEGYIVRQMINEFDDVIEGSLAKGQIPQLQIAREANRKYKNSEAIENAFNKVDIKPGKRTEGYRKVAENLLKNDRQMRYFTDAEKEVLQQMASGTASQRLLATLGRFDFSAKGLAGAINLFTMANAPWTALLFVGTGGAKYMADRKAIESAKKLIAQAGGVEAVKKASQNPNAASVTLGGVTADQIREELALDEETN